MEDENGWTGLGSQEALYNLRKSRSGKDLGGSRSHPARTRGGDKDGMDITPDHF